MKRYEVKWKKMNENLVSLNEMEIKLNKIHEVEMILKWNGNEFEMKRQLEWNGNEFEMKYQLKWNENKIK